MILNHLKTQNNKEPGQRLFTKQEQKWLEGDHWSVPVEPPGQLDRTYNNYHHICEIFWSQCLYTVTASILDDCEEQAGGGGGRARSSLEQYHKSECNLRLGG